MTLIEFLNRQRIESLQRLEMFWTDAYRSSSSKSALISRIRTAMITGPVLLGRFQALPAAERRLLEILLKSSNEALGNVQNDTDGSSGIVDLLENLADKGFIDYRPGELRGSPVANAFLSEEVAESLKKILHDDVRHPEQILSLRSFLLSHDLGDTSELVSDLGIEIQTGDDAPGLADQLLTPANIQTRLNALESPELKKIVELAVREHSGMVPLSVVKKEIEPFTDAMAEEWREQLETCLLGSIGSLSLNHLGINVRSEYVVVFLEVTAQLIKEETIDPPADLQMTSSGFKILLDFVHLQSQIQREALRVTQTGGLRKHGSEETLKSFLLTDTEKGPVAYLETLVAISRRLELTRKVKDGTLTPTLKAIEWLQEPVDRQARDLLPAFMDANQSNDTKQHSHRGLFSGWCRQLKPGKWYSAQQAARLAIIQYLLKLVSGEQELGNITYQAIHTTPVSLNHLIQDYLKWLQTEPTRIGAVDIVRDGKEPVCIRTTQVASVLYGTPWERDPEHEQKIIINPDYEIVLFPGATAPDLHQLVHRVANLFKVDQILHYRLEENSIATAAALGMTLEEMIEGLTNNSVSGLSQNIKYSIEGWAGKVYNVTVRQFYILELPSEELVQVVKRLPEMAPLVVREISPTVLALKEAPADRNTIRALQALGIYVRR